MVNYKILAWSASKLKNDYNPSPIIYIYPDDNLKKYIYDNKDIIHFVIKDSDSVYDNKKYMGVVSKSENIPCYRPNYYSITGQYVITLNSYWNGFPSKKGYIVIDDIVKFDNDNSLIISEKQELIQKIYDENKKIIKDNDKKSLGYKYIYVIIVIVLFIYLIYLINYM